jgi:hypothetical protein
MFLQGSAGTEKTFTVKDLIRAHESCRRKCLICGTTRITVVQYPGGTTLHSLSRLGIEEEFRGSFRSNIFRDTPQARHIFAADLLIIDEVSMLTSWVANRVSMTLQSISDQDQCEFGEKQILFVCDLLQLPPVVSNFAMPVVHRLITRLPYWSSIGQFQLQQPMRAPDPLWARFLLSIAKGRSHNVQHWREVPTRYRVTVTQDVGIPQMFFCFGLQPSIPFPQSALELCYKQTHESS